MSKPVPRNFFIKLTIIAAVITGLATATFAQSAPVPEALRAEAVRVWFSSPVFVASNQVHTSYIELEEAPENFPPVFRMRFDDDTGAAEFYDELMGDDTPFFTTGATPNFNKWFLADYRHAKRTDEWLLTRREYVYYEPMFAMINPHGMQKQKMQESEKPRTGPVGPQLRFASFDVALPDEIKFGVEWDEGFEIPLDLLDLYAKTNLTEHFWHYVAQFRAVEAKGDAAFTLNANTVLPDMAEFFTNMVRSPPPVVLGFTVSTNFCAPPADPVFLALLGPNYEYGAVKTNNIYAKQHEPRGFFKIGSLTDSMTNGVPDAYRQLVSNPAREFLENQLAGEFPGGVPEEILEEYLRELVGLPSNASPQMWFTLTGDLGQDQVKSLMGVFTIPAGCTYVIAVGVHSQEYPTYTGSNSHRAFLFIKNFAL